MIQISAFNLDWEGAKNIYVPENTDSCLWRTLDVPHWGLASIWIWSLVFDKPIIRLFYLYLDFEGTKIIHVL